MVSETVLNFLKKKRLCKRKTSFMLIKILKSWFSTPYAYVFIYLRKKDMPQQSDQFQDLSNSPTNKLRYERHVELLSQAYESQKRLHKPAEFSVTIKFLGAILTIFVSVLVIICTFLIRLFRNPPSQ